MWFRETNGQSLPTQPSEGTIPWRGHAMPSEAGAPTLEFGHVEARKSCGSYQTGQRVAVDTDR